jgi:tetratricopeptide (TPR) repeat protein
MVRLLLLVWATAVSCGALAQSDADRCNDPVGTVDEAIEACTRAIESKRYSNENLAILLNSRGISWRQKGNDDKALIDFDEAIRLDPNSATAYSSRGNLWGDQGDNDKALADYNEAIRLNPKLPPAFSNRAVSWMAKGDKDRALADLNEAIRLDPTFMDAYNNRGFVWRVSGDTGRAVADYTQVIRLNPDFADAYDSLAVIFAASADAKFRNGKRAVEMARKACELTGWKNPYYLNTLAAAYAESRDFAQAVSWQEKALGFKAFSKLDTEAAEARLKLYREKKPFYEPARPKASAK